ncbi:hypothetical protein [Pseudonocardia humida]|uniref:hypothetical protein n=1 Tax=Pseudonocardia humida TaxID=2800819 RepID=UPI00207CEB14|nr:hypothetical protein [Pseudonocardia humida]
MSTTRSCPSAASSSTASSPAREKSRSTQCSPALSSGTPIRITGTPSAAATGMRASTASMPIITIASQSARPASRVSPAAPSSAVTSSTSWSSARAQPAIVSRNGRMPAVSAPGPNGTTRPITWVRWLASARAPALGW